MINAVKHALAGADIPCFDPGVHTGLVTASYVVAYDRGVTPQPGTKGRLGQRVFEIVLLSPLKKQEELMSLEKGVISALKAIPNLKYTGEIQPTGIESEFKGVSKSLLFRQPTRQ